jgi:16S rRNA (uracil1498-N3)-methyltransferase
MKERPGRVPRLFADTELRSGAMLELAEQAAHHAARVLRLREGDPVILFDGRGGEYEARLTMPGRDQVVAEVGAKREVEREAPLQVTLVQAVSTGEKMDYPIQKAVELGAVAIQPVLASRSVARPKGERAESRREHWHKVVIAACEQCGRNRIPEVRPLLAMSDHRAGEGMKLLLSPLSELAFSRVDLKGEEFTVAAGPEAGFTAEEEASLAAQGFLPVKIGARTLRTETAALAALAALSALRGDF